MRSSRRICGAGEPLLYSPRVPRLRHLLFALALVGGAAPAWAGEPRVDLPWAVRGEAFLVSGSGLFGTTAGSVAATVQRSLGRRFAWEETVGWGAGNREVHGKDAGVTLAGTGRVAALMTERRTHALTFGLGTALIFGGGYGTLNFLYAEAGYEYRAANGLSLIVVAGPNMLLSRPSVDVCASQSWFCNGFRRGDLAGLGHLRAGAGWAF
jgi:hypothetical protein